MKYWNQHSNTQRTDNTQLTREQVWKMKTWKGICTNIHTIQTKVKRRAVYSLQHSILITRITSTQRPETQSLFRNDDDRETDLEDEDKPKNQLQRLAKY